jgi:hypothetical protein
MSPLSSYPRSKITHGRPSQGFAISDVQAGSGATNFRTVTLLVTFADCPCRLKAPSYPEAYWGSEIELHCVSYREFESPFRKTPGTGQLQRRSTANPSPMTHWFALDDLTFSFTSFSLDKTRSSLPSKRAIFVSPRASDASICALISSRDISLILLPSAARVSSLCKGCNPN